MARQAQAIPKGILWCQFGQLDVVLNAQARQPPFGFGGHVGHARQVTCAIGLGTTNVIVLADGATDVDVVVGFPGVGFQHGHRPIAQEIFDSQAIGGQVKFIRPFARIDDTRGRVDCVAIEPAGGQRFFEQQGVVGDLDEMLVAGRLAGLEVPDAQAAATLAGDDFQEVRTRGPDTDARRVQSKAGEECGGAVGRGLQVDEDLGGEARWRALAQNGGQLSDGQGANCLAFADGHDIQVIDLFGTVRFLQHVHAVDLELVAGGRQQRDTGPAGGGRRLGNIPTDALALPVGGVDAVPTELAVAAVAKVGGDN